MLNILPMKTILLFCLLFSISQPTHAQKTVHRTAHKNPTAAYKWLEILLEASARDVDANRARPTVLSRTMAIVLTSMYDAWAAYDEKAVGTRLAGTLRRPQVEHTLENKEKAIAFAAYRSLLYVYSNDIPWIRSQMVKMNYKPDDVSQAALTGSAAADAVIAFRKKDGSNQSGNEPGGNGNPYSDTSNYVPKNAPDKMVDYLTWLPISFDDGKGGKFTPSFLTPHWYRVKPLALKASNQFRSPPPPKYNSETLRKEVEEAIYVNAHLTLEQKAVVEFMRDGPRSTGQSGHWLQFAQDVSRRDQTDLDTDVKLFFSVGNIVFDTFISCWETKRFYDTSRPYWWTRHMKKGEEIKGWAGPGKGTRTIKAEDWMPYSPSNFITPPFPGYVSGHAAASGASAKILELFTGSDDFDAIAIREVGELTEPNHPTKVMQAVDGKLLEAAPESKQMTLQLPTFTATAEMAAVSRLWGGYHIRTDNEEGLKMGRKVAEYSWPIYQSYFNGTFKQK